MSKTMRVLHTEWSDSWGGQEIRIINEMIAVLESYAKKVKKICFRELFYKQND